MTFLTSVLGKVFGTEKAVDNILDKDKGLLAKAGAWVGNMNLTDEEKMENNLLVRDWGLRQLEALAPFKVMQRIMVTIIMTGWFILFNAIILAVCFGTEAMVTDLVIFAKSEFAYYPIGAAVTLYLLGGVWKGKS